MTDTPSLFRLLYRTSSRLYNKPDLPKLTRDNDMDLIRFLLAGCVLFYHTRILAGGLDFPLSNLSAIPVFLFLSGLLVTESFYGSPDIKAYVEKRVRRIYPAYLAAVLIGGALAYLGWRYLAGSSPSLQNLGRYWGFNALFANWMAPCVVDAAAHPACPVNGSLWIIKWEVIFYAALPLLLVLFSRLNKYIYIGLILMIALGLSREMSPYVRIFICFLMGISTYFLKGLWIPALTKLPPIPALLRQTLILILFLIAYKLPYGLFLTLLMGAAFYPTRPGLKINIMKFGDISYGIFLIHFPIIAGIYVFWPVAPEGIAASAIIFALSALLSMGLYKYVEAPFLLPSSYYRKAHKSANTP